MDARQYRLLNGETQIVEPPSGGVPFTVLITRDDEEAVAGAIPLDLNDPYAAICAIESEQGPIFSQDGQFYSVKCAPSNALFFAVLSGTAATITIIF